MTAKGLAIVVPWMLTLLTLGVGLWKFTAEGQQANRKPFLEKQLEIGFKAVDTVSVLATEEDPKEWEKARAEFWRLYWGSLSVVEDRAVEGAMVNLGQLVPNRPQSEVKLPMSSLNGPSYQLAHAVRDLVLSSWQVDLPPVTGARVAK